MKRIVVLIALSFLICTGAAQAKDWTKIRVAIEGAYPPFSQVSPDGTLIGFDVDIAVALCEAIGAEPVLVAQDWDGMIPGLLARKYDTIIASMSITEERLQKVDFTKKYYQTPAKFMVKKGIIPQFSMEALKGKVIGVQRETIHDKYLTDIYGKTVEIKRYGSLDEAYLDVEAGRIDIVMADSVALMEGFLSKDKGADYEFVGPDMVDPKFFGPGIGAAVRKQDGELKQKLNEAIDTIRANGTYEKIQNKYFNFNVYGE
ncbi:ABC transporter substrate-binding protein [Desulfosediminicola flagellatus]|uniref:ABC transporter substrate-binding protein n=1 Tax=Desulfosediminicola flagellatus TaxID=2569541 RepID=UPI0010AC4A77|nr:ABC transporter substrate-binding protein [Desulfosediminicola flagellatus]